MTDRQILTAARDLIADPENWTQGEFARDHQGTPVDDPCSPTATSWSAVGAIRRVAGGNQKQALIPEAAMRRILGGGWHNTRAFNDHPGREHRDVLALFDRVVASLPRRPA